MERSLIILVFSLCCGMILQAQDAPGSSDHKLFPRMKGFKLLEYDVTETTSYRFHDEDSSEIVVAGRLLYYYYESDTDVAPERIISAVSATAKEMGARTCSHDGNKLCMIIQQDNVEVWADLSAGDFYYTLRIIERAEINQEVTAESIRNDLASKDETVLYIRFSYRGEEIQPYSMPAIAALAEVMKGDAQLNVEIEGHTDSEGSELENRKISLERAASIGLELIKAGINRDRLGFIGLGEGKPVADTETPEGKALNRRIVIRKK